MSDTKLVVLPLKDCNSIGVRAPHLILRSVFLLLDAGVA
jgi:hypothetical protein